MSWRALIVATLLVVRTVAAQELPLATEELLHSARVWEARDRGDLARLALEKLVAARPDSPYALVELGELHLRMADIAQAQAVQERLTQRFPNSPATRTFAVELRFATRDRLQLASVQRLIQINRGAAAQAELAKLFPDGAPDGTLGIEYFRLLSSTPGGWERALSGLTTLAGRHADDPRYQVALGRHQLQREATAIEGARLLSRLAARDDVKTREIDDPLGSALKELGYRRAPIDVLRSYSARHPDDSQMTQLLAQRLRIENEQALLLREAAKALDPEQQRRNLIEMQEALLATRAAETSADRTVALLRRLRGATEERAIRFDPTIEAALQWAVRSRASGVKNTELAAVEKSVAVAFCRNDFEAAIGLSQQLERLTSSADADGLLEQAARLDEGSTWLFETQVRRRLAQGHTDEALQLIEARPLDARWTSSSRDELLATALDQRAQAALTAGDLARARADLERAIELAPAYPWTRFRLAGLLARDGNREGGKALMAQGMQRAPTNVEMRYAQALYLSSIEDYDDAVAALESIAPESRSEAMHELDRRLQIERARRDARRHAANGELAAARAALLSVEGLTRTDLEATRQLANAWVDLGDAQHGLALFDSFLDGTLTSDSETHVLLSWADVLIRTDDTRLATVLDDLNDRTSLTAEQQQHLAELQRGAELRSIGELQRDGQFAQAIEKLDALLSRSPDDRALRIARAELDLAAGDFGAARDRFAGLVAEQPDDLDTRLSYARALTGAGNLDLARLQVQTIAEQAPTDSVELRLSLARRQLDLGDPAAASRTLDGLLASDPTRSDALMLAGRANLAQRDFLRARELFSQAERSSDVGESAAARLAREAIETRLQSWMEAAAEYRHKPGDSGISQFDSMLVPTLWRYARDYEHRFTLRADAVSVDAGTLTADFDTAALLGTIQAAGPSANRRYANDRQDGLSVGLRYDSDTVTADIGTTPLGFLMSNIVGGIEWTPEWQTLDLAFGLRRRAVTSSVLSYAGMRDPISGREWGGVVETGPYVEAGLYRENYSVAGSVRYTQLTGTGVEDNTFIGARTAADWKFWSRPQARAFVGVTVNLWSYEHNVQNYTYGHGGYYSPESYLSVALPVELQGTWRDWSYRLRASLSYSQSDIERAAFYPTDAALQAAAAASALPSGFDAPYYEAEDGGGISLSAYAAVEKQVSRHFVVGAKLDIDRADYYEPTVFMLYVRHVFGSAPTPLAIPPRPVRAYND